MRQVLLISSLHSLTPPLRIRRPARLRSPRHGILIQIIIKNILLLIQILINKPENKRRDESHDRRTSERPDNVRIADRGRSGEVDRVLDGRHEAVDGGDETSHVLGSAGVGDSVGSDIDEDFAECGDGEGDCGPPDGDWRDEGDTVGVDAGEAGSAISARSSGVGVVSDDRPADGADGANEHAGEHSGDGTEFDLVLSEHGVQAIVEDGDTEENDEGVEVGDNVVGNTVCC